MIISAVFAINVIRDFSDDGIHPLDTYDKCSITFFYEGEEEWT